MCLVCRKERWITILQFREINTTSWGAKTLANAKNYDYSLEFKVQGRTIRHSIGIQWKTGTVTTHHLQLFSSSHAYNIISNVNYGLKFWPNIPCESIWEANSTKNWNSILLERNRFFAVTKLPNWTLNVPNVTKYSYQFTVKLYTYRIEDIGRGSDWSAYAWFEFTPKDTYCPTQSNIDEKQTRKKRNDRFNHIDRWFWRQLRNVVEFAIDLV